MNDPGYKRLFSRPAMIRDLLSGFAAQGWSDTLDFGSLDALPASYVSRDLHQRHSDLVWRVRFQDERWLYVVVLLEFQSTVDQRMAVRMLTYTGLLYERLIADGALQENDKLPPVLPIVIYNGARRWSAPTGLHELIATGPSTALAVYQPSLRYFLLDHGRVQSTGLPPGNLVSALVALETSTNPAETAAATDRLIDLLAKYDDPALTEAFSAWVDALLLPQTRTEASSDPLTRLKEVRTMLAERVQEWTREWVEQGHTEGVEQGRTEGREQGRTEGREQGRTEGREQGRTEGVEQGRTEGREQVLAAERTLLRRQAARKFEAATADQLTDAIADMDDPERLAEVGETIIDCNTASDLIERIRIIRRQDGAENQH